MFYRMDLVDKFFIIHRNTLILLEYAPIYWNILLSNMHEFYQTDSQT
jgi:hypothetical protein